MVFENAHKELQQAQTEAQAILTEDHKPELFSSQNVSTFCGQLRYSIKLIVEEKEIIVFAILQWVAIIIGYLLWTQVLDWIPDRAWKEVGHSNDRHDRCAFMLLNLVLIGWSALIVELVSYPISLFSAAMVAAHYLRHSGQLSTFERCLRLAGRNLGKLWVFTAIDAWITVNAILDRLPRKNHTRTATDEFLYYAWKIGTVGVFPGLVSGKGFADAVTDSLSLLKKEPTRMIGIRMGYSLICWIIGIVAYVAAIFFFCAFGGARGANEVYNFYFLMVVPIFFAVGITAVLVRPFYLIMTARLYTDTTPAFPIQSEEAPTGGAALMLIFALLLCLVVATVLFGDHLGIVGWIESMADKDIASYRLNNP